MSPPNLNRIFKNNNPVHIISGIDSLKKLNELILRDNLLFITTSGSTIRGISEKVREIVGKSQVIIYDKVNSYPELDNLDAITNFYRNFDITCILALGGGSVIDTAKVLSATLQSIDKLPLHNTFRKNNSISWNQKLPLIAIPTTSGTGSEVTPFATVWDHKLLRKYSLSDKALYPDYALLDPSLTLTLPHQETLYTGLDAISHAMESLWNKNRTLVSQRLAFKSLELAIESLPIVLEEPRNLYHRNNMQIASLLAGLAISQTRTAIAHSISYPLTLYHNVPHGLACSFTLVSIAKQLIEKNIFFKVSIFESLIVMLESFNLAHEIKKYINQTNIFNLIPFMFTPERSDNFVKTIDEKEIKLILQKSIEEKY